MSYHKWNKNETELLIKLYSNTINSEIAKTLNRSQKSIELKANRLNLKKSLEFKSNYISKRNKKIGRDLNYETLKNIALKYQTRSEFQTKDPSAYTTARKSGFLNEFCKHMPIIKFSTPQLILKNILIKLLNSNCLYNERKLIYPYEIDIFFPKFNLAFEYQGSFWHQNNTKDDIKNNLFIENKINIIYIHETSRNYEKDIKNELKLNLKKINIITNKNLTEDNIEKIEINNIFLNVYNKEQLFLIAKSYNSYKEFLQKEKTVHRKLYKLNLLDEATLHMKDRKKNHSIESIKETIKNYKNLKNFRLNEYGSYLYIKKNKLDYLINHLATVNKKINISIEEIKNLTSKYTSKYKFKTENKQIYNYIKRHKLTYLLKDLKNRQKS